MPNTKDHSATNFVHLRMHSEFSIVDGMVRIKPLISQLQANSMKAAALTDECNLFGLIKFFNSMVSSGLKPIIGSDFWIKDNNKHHLITFLAKNKLGYQNIIRLISLAYQENQHLGKPYLKYEWFADHSEGIIALSGHRLGDVGQSLLSEDREKAISQLNKWLELFPDSYYLEIERTARKNDEEHLHQVMSLATEFNCPVVATNDVRFLRKEEFEAHEVRVCIHEGRVLHDPRRPRLYSEEQYFKSSQQMAEIFSDIPEAISNSVEIAKRCNVEIELGKSYLPNFPIPENDSLDSFFTNECKRGLALRLEESFGKDSDDFTDKEDQYSKRLQFELGIINQMGFAGYFLIVMDFIRWAKKNHIPVGPGRGSGAGSLVAYSLRITDLDPIEYDLLFERFLNPERVSMPDFDIDFCMDNRDRVIEYVSNTYGRNAVSQIITFGSMAAKAAIRDVARVQGKSYGLADKLSKMIPFEVGMTLAKAIEQEQTLRDFLKADDAANEIMEMAFKLEGLTRNVGKHAGGVVISPTSLTDFAPLYCEETGKGLIVQFDKDDIEQVGLVKFDFLGLRTLTIIDTAVNSINAYLTKKEGDQAKLIDIDHIDLADKKSFDLLCSAQTTAVFQLESRGMKELIARLKPTLFEEIIALVALFRPGPLQSGMVDDFINRKHGRADIVYLHPDLEPVLNKTYGVILYQEQVMQIAQVLANYSLGQADMLRRAMGKKKAKEMMKQKNIFVEGAIANNIDEDIAKQVFDLMEKFAGYGFNKSHSAAYALISFQTLWLKTHYPAFFMAAVLSADMDNTDKVVRLIEECRQMGLQVLPPNINVSQYAFSVGEGNEIIYGLGAIKGVGESSIEMIVKKRDQKDAFRNLFEFCERVNLKKANRRTLEALIKSGACDVFKTDRYNLLVNLDDAVKAAEQKAFNQSVGLRDLFEIQGQSIIKAEYKASRIWNEKERLAAEKEALGLYLLGHPYDQYECEMKHFKVSRIAALEQGNRSVRVGGLIVALRVMNTKKGGKMAFVSLDDRSGRIELSFFSEAYLQFQQLLKKDAVVIAEGDVSMDDYNQQLKMTVRQLRDIDHAREAYAKSLRIDINKKTWSDLQQQQLIDEINAAQRGSLIVEINYQNQQAAGMIRLDPKWSIKPSDELLDRLKAIVEPNALTLQY